MNNNIRCLLLACQELGLPTKNLHPTKNVVEVMLGGTKLLFANWSTPFNSHSVSRICSDKDYTYTLLEGQLPMPRTKSYLSPFVADNFKKYLKYHTVEEVTSAITEEFSTPVVIKRNAGSHGVNVFICRDNAEALEAVTTIFNTDSKDYDFVGLGQQYIDIEHEYRVVCLNGETRFVYRKDISDATFDGNVSPLHFENAHAVLVEDSSVLDEIYRFSRGVSEYLGLAYGGLDIVQDKQNRWWLLEVNSSPGFDHFVRDNGDEQVIRLFSEALQSM